MYILGFAEIYSKFIPHFPSQGLTILSGKTKKTLGKTEPPKLGANRLGPMKHRDDETWH